MIEQGDGDRNGGDGLASAPPARPSRNRGGAGGAGGAGPAIPAPAVNLAPLVPTELAASASPAPRVPGSTGDNFQRFPTGMVDLPPGEAVDRSEGAEPVVPGWAGPRDTPVSAAPYRGVAGWGLAFAIVGLVASFVVGWGFPVSLVGLITGAIALRRPAESRAIAAWSLALGITGLVYSAGWLVFAALSADLFG